MQNRIRPKFLYAQQRRGMPFLAAFGLNNDNSTQAKEQKPLLRIQASVKKANAVFNTST